MRMENKKQEVIRKVYGSNFQKYDVTEYGYSSEDNSEFYPDIEWHPSIPHLWRPYGLRGIENNNGWIAIESEEDLPKETIDCFFFDKYENCVVCGGYNADFKKFTFSAFSMEWDEHISHYQPIIKPENPLY